MDYPCYVDIWLVYFGYIPWSVTIVLFMARSYTRMKASAIFANEARDEPVAPENLDEHLAWLTAICTENTTAFLDRYTLAESVDNTAQNSMDDVAPFLALSPPEEERAAGKEMPHQPGTGPYIERRRRSSVQGVRVVEWRRRFSSAKFVTYVIGTTVAIVVFMMIMFTIFSPKMAFKPVHFNCVRGWEFLPIVAISGVFNVLICPAFVIIVWSYQDGYGIRTSLVISSTLGVTFWAASLTWRVVHHNASILIAASLFFLGEVIFVYTTTIVVPLVVSIRFASRKRANSQAELSQEESSWLWSTSVRRRHYGANKQAFLAAIQDGAEYGRIKKCAQECFCEELVLFLNVHASLKEAVLAAVRQQQEFVNSPQSPLSLASQANLSTPQRTRTAPNFILRHFGRSRPATPSSQPQTRESSTNHREPVSYSKGIVESLQQAFPTKGFDGSTHVPERLRSTLLAIIKTFILPESLLAINATDDVVAACRSYLRGDELALGILDSAKDQVLDLLYTNVYLRFRQA
ncbi:hypothetical protein H4S02_003278 [Coemansia sp. RSA 2611]|nr:hypothetical protein IWW51_000796 [Coemansia sp. RSA 2702]KAJ2387618.1 hypothetical protein H4S02_003278 [Coemansia sp. RSA 2611]